MAPTKAPLQEPLLGSSSSSTPDYFTTCSWWSYLFFCFPFPLLKLGNSRVLGLSDLPPAPASCKPELLVARFQHAWEAQSGRRRRHSIRRALWSCLWKDVGITACFAFVKGMGVLSGPIFLYFFVDYASSEEQRGAGEGVALVAFIAVMKLMENMAQRHWYFGVRVIAGKMQSIMMGAVYGKELRLSSAGRRRHGVGEIVNYITVDVNRLAELSWRLHWAWLVAVIFVGAMGIAWTVVGAAALPGGAIVVLVLLFMPPLITSMQRSQLRLMAAQDERLRRTTELLHGIKVVKLQAWEHGFHSSVASQRGAEFAFLSQTQHKRNYTTVIYWLMPTVLSCVVLSATLLLGTATLTSTVVFTVLATFRIIQDPVRMTPEVLAAFIQAHISFHRLETFLQEEELADANDGHSAHPPPLFPIQVDDATLSWAPDDAAVPALVAVNLVVKHGEKVAVCGAVGSGKSSLLLALLGEIPKLSGSVRLSGSVAYVPQAAWIQTLTVRDNILFGKPYDRTRYKKALRACALEEDIKGFSHGDLTEIGERGVNMSGGQKQRIQLARAVYSDADIYLLDDPFSAVDAQTASTLFHDCVMGALRDKTVVLVTHQVEFLPSVDTILVMHQGKIKQAGAYSDLLIAGDVFSELVSAHHEALRTVLTDKDTREQHDDRGARFKDIQKRLSREESLTEILQPSQATQLVQAEVMVSGSEGLTPYLNYIRISSGHFVAAVLLLSQVLFSGSQLYSNLWLAQGISNLSLSSAVVVGVYIGISAICVLAFVLRSEMIVQLGLLASKSFFQKLMTSIMKAPMSFFDATPSGRILNRASVDMSVIDLDIPFAMGLLLGNLFDLICIIVVTSIVTWQILVVLLPVLVLTHFLQTYYAAAARELNRINSITKAPIVNSSAETFSGSATIRAFKQMERFWKHNLELIDCDVSAYIYKFAALEWMVLRIDLASTCVFIVAAASLVLFKGSISGGLVGLAVTYALALSSALAVFCIWRCFLGIYIVAVERIKQYLDLPAEAPAVIESHRPPPQWPSNGEVCLDHVEVRYRPSSPLVLKGITCTFVGGQKVGVVGRTGSGKTTLISTLFRLVEPCSGRILIDGIDIASIGLHDLRFRLGIIPQEPVLFQGTVRSNLDPLDQYADIDIWEALKRCQLGDVIEKQPLGLDSPVSDGGENWSAGQRQLFCLGRVLLKQSKVLVLDEATASIDSATDALLQAVIRQEFAACSVITIAHRIPTVIDSDMVLTLRDGFAAEFDSPKKLIENKTSLFALLVAEYWAQAGRNSAKES